MPKNRRVYFHFKLEKFARWARGTSLFSAVLLIGGLSASGPVLAVNFCSLTLNSNAEIEVFKKNYGKIPGNKFIELTDYLSPFDKGEDIQSGHWLKRACRAGVQCDVLLISGHFAGEFFGRTPISLPLEDMEELSCEEICSGIFKRPKEVMLMGCNTLAGKGTQRESMDSYIGRLTAHYGETFSHPSQIERVAAFRYLPFGLTYGDRMRRIFSQSVKVYGFDAAAPVGEQAAPQIQHYINMVGPSYGKHLKSLRRGEENRKLARVFQGVNFVEVDSPATGKPPVCVIQDAAKTRVQKLAWIEQQLLSPEWMSYVPAISRHFSEIMDEDRHRTWDEESRKLYERLRTNRAIYDRVVGAMADKNLQKLISIRFELVRLLEVMGFDSRRLSENYRAMITSMFPKSPGSTAQAQQSLCTAEYSPLARASLYLEDIHRLNQAVGLREEGRVSFVEIMSCLSPTAPEIVDDLVQKWALELKKKVAPEESVYGQILSEVSKHTMITGARLLKVLKAHPSAQDFVIEQILAHQNQMDSALSTLMIKALKTERQRSLVLQAIAMSKTGDLRIHQELLRLVRLKSVPESQKIEIARVLEVVESTHLEVQLEITRVYLNGTSKLVGPRALRRAQKATIHKIISTFSEPRATQVRKRRAYRLLASAAPNHFLVRDLVRAKIKSGSKEDLILIGQVLNEGLINQDDPALAGLVLEAWRRGFRELGVGRYLVAQFQLRTDVIQELLWNWRDLSPMDPRFNEMKSVLDSRVIWRAEVLETLFQIIQKSGNTQLSLRIIEFFRMAIVPEDFKVLVAKSLQAVHDQSRDAEVRRDLAEILPILRADAGLDH